VAVQLAHPSLVGFSLPQRVEDRVLEVLVKKTETIKKEPPPTLGESIRRSVARRLVPVRRRAILRRWVTASIPENTA
jgi:hypothetical protein